MSNDVNGSMMFLVFLPGRLRLIVVLCPPFVGSDVFFGVLGMELEAKDAFVLRNDGLDFAF